MGLAELTAVAAINDWLTVFTPVHARSGKTISPGHRGADGPSSGPGSGAAWVSAGALVYMHSTAVQTLLIIRFTVHLRPQSLRPTQTDRRMPLALGANRLETLNELACELHHSVVDFAETERHQVTRIVLIQLPRLLVALLGELVQRARHVA